MLLPPTLPQLSIKTRLNLLVGALLLMALAANIAAIVWSAGPRIRAENESILKLTRQIVDRQLSGLGSSPDPSRDISRLLDLLSDVRHARVSFEPVDVGGPPPPLADSAPFDDKVPRWFSRLVSPDRAPIKIPLNAGLDPIGTLVIASNPGDETAEIWEAVKGTATNGLALIATVFALTTLAVHHALKPISNLGRALSAMQGGNYRVELATSGPPELAAISSKVNHLAQALASTQRENSRLAGEIISLEDRERRELARELHDEFGPYLFSIRANVAALQGLSNPSGQVADTKVFAAKCESTLDQIGALQQVNRRVLQRLRPPALAELGLEGALRGLIAQWRENHPDVHITLETNLSVAPLDETSALTVYRVVQEGLTNAFRHANASTISVIVAANPSGEVSVQVKDDGSGLGEDMRPGFGLSGMGERVWALGGTMSATNSANGGMILDVTLPAPVPVLTDVVVGPGTPGILTRT